MSDPIKILQCLPGNIGFGGIENFVMNLYKNIDKSKVQFDFLIHGERRNCNEEIIKKLGGKIYRVPFAKKYKDYIKKTTKFFIENGKKYEAIHIHCSYAISYFDAKMAKKYGIKNIIVHSHSSNTEITKRRIAQILLKDKLSKIANYKIACSEEAAKWMFSNKVIKNKQYQVIKNSINVDKYKFNTNIREKIRKELNLEDKLVIGHVGRLSKVKNHDFLLEIFKEICNKREQVRLILVGDGECKEGLIKKTKKLQLLDKVIFLGNIDNVNEILQAIDLFVFPSIHEGFPLSVIEAQTTGLPCFISDVITKDVAVTDLVTFISLEKTQEEWSNIILGNKQLKRENKSDIIKQQKYDIIDMVKQIEEIYLKR